MHVSTMGTHISVAGLGVSTARWAYSISVDSYAMKTGQEMKPSEQLEVTHESGGSSVHTDVHTEDTRGYA
jgi:hypothetical protein